MAITLTIDCLDDRAVATTRNADTSEAVASASVSYGDAVGTYRVDLSVWLRSLEQAVEQVLGGADPVAAGIGEAVLCACPKGLVALDVDGTLIGSALVGDDPDTAPDAKWLTKQLEGGADGWTAAVGSAPTAAWTASKLSWLHRSDAAAWDRLHLVLQPQDWLVLQLTGAAVTDTRTAGATGYWSAADGYRFDLLAIVDRDRDWATALPDVAVDGAVVGTWRGVPVRLHVA